jgi:bacterioferritin-associated ferredoxin
VYVCNCNGIRERDVISAVDQGALRPAQVFRRYDGLPRCAKCVCQLRRLIEARRAVLQVAAE